MRLFEVEDEHLELYELADTVVDNGHKPVFHLVELSGTSKVVTHKCEPQKL